MKDQDFNIDHVLHNIKERLRERENPHATISESVIELTDVVNIETETHNFPSFTQEKHNQLYDPINNASINKELEDLDASKIKKRIMEATEKSDNGIDQEKLEFLIRRELSRAFKGWAEKNLKHLVKDLVHKEIIKMLREAD